MKIKYSNPQKAHPCRKNTSTKRRAVTIHPPARLVGEPKKTKKKEKKKGRKTPETVANWLSLDMFNFTPTSSDQNQTLHGGCVVIHVKCDPNRFRGYGAVGGENGPFLLLWPVAYTTACTTVQAVIAGRGRVLQS